MNTISPISAVVFIFSWLQLRRISKIWMQKPVSTDESITAGIAAWFFLFSILAWFFGIYLLFIQVLTEKGLTDIFILTFLVLLSAYIFYFYMQSRYELRYDETMDFWKEALQFRRSEQRRLDILDLMQKERERKKKKKNQKKKLYYKNEHNCRQIWIRKKNRKLNLSSCEKVSASI
ncbi:MAG: hypothetical protein JXA06_01610 [Bacteroidetes bacterium]|nr:hypothetical protein [Bacteroidota bacterium]